MTSTEKEEAEANEDLIRQHRPRMIEKPIQKARYRQCHMAHPPNYSKNEKRMSGKHGLDDALAPIAVIEQGFEFTDLNKATRAALPKPAR
jgi:hypothetical protein